MLLIADALAEQVFAAAKARDAFTRVRDVSAESLRRLTLAHPLRGVEGADGEWDYDVPLLPGDHVTDEAGHRASFIPRRATATTTIRSGLNIRRCR